VPDGVLNLRRVWFSIPPIIWASANEDHFVYNSTGDSPAGLIGRDTINGFDASQDVFDLRGLNVTNWAATDQGGEIVVDLFTNGHAVADMEIGLVGLVGTLSQSNFLLIWRAERSCQ
jgi:Ca2+-binding RTX toxin-like protein